MATSDWEFEVAPWWNLDTSTYVSAPSSVYITGSNWASYLGNTDVKNGQILTWAKGAGFLFAGYRPGVIEISTSINDADWTQRGLRWWQGYNLQNQPATLWQAGTVVGGVWTWGATQYGNPLTSSTNKCGVGSNGAVNFDDTEIWLPS